MMAENRLDIASSCNNGYASMEYPGPNIANSLPPKTMMNNAMGAMIIMANLIDFMAEAFNGRLCEPSTNNDIEIASGTMNRKVAIEYAI